MSLPDLDAAQPADRPNAPRAAKVRVRVPGKINLALAVGPLAADGFHPLSTVFQAVSLFEDVQARWRDDDQIRLQMTGQGSEELPCDQTNLAVRAALALRQRHGSSELGVDLRIDKQIPMAGGMAGGSADAAGTLLACNALWGLGLGLPELSELAAELGSDVAFGLHAGNALGTGRGEQLTALPASGRLDWVFAVAPRGLSTPAVYRHFDLMAERGELVPSAQLAAEVVATLSSGTPDRVAGALRNDLQPAAVALYPELAATLTAGEAVDGVLASLVCGSGPTSAFLCVDAAAADRLAADLGGLPEVRQVLRAFGPAPRPKLEVTV